MIKGKLSAFGLISHRNAAKPEKKGEPTQNLGKGAAMRCAVISRPKAAPLQ